MTIEIVLLVVGVLLAIGEFAVWELAILWHSEEKRDPRNMRPPF
ncbi:MAG TPA: hypothetical protein VNM89_06970 [Solirubrobacterales bacterium]|nr:hypothetical protein [Solirubrobacterales bacterium]